MISSTAIIYPGVELGENVAVGDFCIIGHPIADGSTPTTKIGDNSVIRSHSVIYAGNQIGSKFACGHKVNIRENNLIGNSVSIGTHSVVEHQVVIGDRVRIHTNVFIPEFSVLENNVWLGPNVVLTNAKYPNTTNTKKSLKGPLLKENTIVGANTTILPGLILGPDVVVGAGSLVTKSIPANKVAYGAPAATHKNRSELTEYG